MLIMRVITSKKVPEGASNEEESTCANQIVQNFIKKRQSSGSNPAFKILVIKHSVTAGIINKGIPPFCYQCIARIGISA